MKLLNIAKKYGKEIGLGTLGVALLGLAATSAKRHDEDDDEDYEIEVDSDDEAEAENDSDDSSEEEKDDAE